MAGEAGTEVTDSATTGSEAAPVTVDDIDLLDALNVDDDSGDISGTTKPTVEEAPTNVDADESGKAPKTEKAPSSSDDTPDWVSSIEDEELREFASGFESRDELVEGLTTLQTALGIQPVKDWRESISDEKLREHAARFPSVSDLVKGNLELRQQVSSALVVPGKDASKEDKAAFASRLGKMLGVPESPAEYTFPDLPEGREPTEEEKASRDGWASLFHNAHMSTRQAEAVLTKFSADLQEAEAAMEEADNQYAEATEAQLRVEWADDYDTNRTLAKRTAEDLFGDDIGEIMQAQMSNGRLLMDNPVMLRMLVRIGREMNEGTAEVLTQSERETLNDQVEDLRRRAEEAKLGGNTPLANKLFQDEQNLLKKIVGNQPIVGDSARSA